MASQAIFGFIGVILGSLTTSVLTIYRERLATRRELTIRDQQYERDRKAARDTFQRESILALQSAVFWATMSGSPWPRRGMMVRVRGGALTLSAAGAAVRMPGKPRPRRWA